MLFTINLGAAYSTCLLGCNLNDDIDDERECGLYAQKWLAEMSVTEERWLGNSDKLLPLLDHWVNSLPNGHPLSAQKSVGQVVCGGVFIPSRGKESLLAIGFGRTTAAMINSARVALALEVAISAIDDPNNVLEIPESELFLNLLDRGCRLKDQAVAQSAPADMSLHGGQINWPTSVGQTNGSLAAGYPESISPKRYTAPPSYPVPLPTYSPPPAMPTEDHWMLPGYGGYGAYGNSQRGLPSVPVPPPARDPRGRLPPGLVQPPGIAQAADTRANQHASGAQHSSMMNPPGLTAVQQPVDADKRAAPLSWNPNTANPNSAKGTKGGGRNISAGLGSSNGANALGSSNSFVDKEIERKPTEEKKDDAVSRFVKQMGGLGTSLISAATSPAVKSKIPAPLQEAPKEEKPDEIDAYTQQVYALFGDPSPEPEPPTVEPSKQDDKSDILDSNAEKILAVDLEDVDDPRDANPVRENSKKVTALRPADTPERSDVDNEQDEWKRDNDWKGSRWENSPYSPKRLWGGYDISSSYKDEESPMKSDNSSYMDGYSNAFNSHPYKKESYSSNSKDSCKDNFGKDAMNGKDYSYSKPDKPNKKAAANLVAPKANVAPPRPEEPKPKVDERSPNFDLNMGLGMTEPVWPAVFTLGVDHAPKKPDPALGVWLDKSVNKYVIGGGNAGNVAPGHAAKADSPLGDDLSAAGMLSYADAAKKKKAEEARRKQEEEIKRRVLAAAKSKVQDAKAAEKAAAKAKAAAAKASAAKAKAASAVLKATTSAAADGNQANASKIDEKAGVLPKSSERAALPSKAVTAKAKDKSCVDRLSLSNKEEYWCKAGKTQLDTRSLIQEYRWKIQDQRAKYLEVDESPWPEETDGKKKGKKKGKVEQLVSAGAPESANDAVRALMKQLPAIPTRGMIAKWLEPTEVGPPLALEEYTYPPSEFSSNSEYAIHCGKLFCGSKKTEVEVPVKDEAARIVEIMQSVDEIMANSPPIGDEPSIEELGVLQVTAKTAKQLFDISKAFFQDIQYHIVNEVLAEVESPAEAKSPVSKCQTSPGDGGSTSPGDGCDGGKSPDSACKAFDRRSDLCNTDGTRKSEWDVNSNKVDGSNEADATEGLTADGISDNGAACSNSFSVPIIRLGGKYSELLSGTTLQVLCAFACGAVFAWLFGGSK